MAQSEVHGNHSSSDVPPDADREAEGPSRERETRTVTGHPETRTVTGHPEARALNAQQAGAAAEQAARAQEREQASPRRLGSRVSSTERDRMVKDAREITFPVALRGYERAAVDRY